MRDWPATTVSTFVIAPIFVLPAQARQKNLVPSSAGPRPNAVRPYVCSGGLRPPSGDRRSPLQPGDLPL